MDQPNWAEIVDAVAASLGVLVAGSALWWAKEAAKKSGEQAKAAQEQVKLLEKQIAVSEPKPVLYLTLDSMNGLKLENIGNDLAFDVSIDPIAHKVSTDVGAHMLTITYSDEPFIRIDDYRWARVASVRPELNERWLTDSFGQTKHILFYMLEHLAVIHRSHAQERGEAPQYPATLISVTVHYRAQHRSEVIARTFNISATAEKAFQCVPSRSLLASDFT